MKLNSIGARELLEKERVNQKDDRWIEHCISVGDSAGRIAKALCEKEINVDIDKAITLGYLHDIGKLMIPSSILQKPAKLTDEEYEIMKKHTIYGYEICMKDKNLKPYSAGALYHHEALNGSRIPLSVF